MGQSGRSLRGTRAKDNGANDDVKKQVDSDDSHQRPIYQLVNVKNGGGKLVEIIKSRMRNSSGSIDVTRHSFDMLTPATQKQHSYSADKDIDNEIRQLVEPLLYDQGRGKLVPLSEIWKWRFGLAANVGSETDESYSTSSTPNTRRWVCWRLEERGFVGETALHICFLLSTQTHMIIAQKLLSMFPMLINDIYTSDEYFGESLLHMAIVNEDVRIVKLLLSHGASVHDRCLGSFFMPIDQKDKANGLVRRNLERASETSSKSGADLLDLESNHYNSMITDYDGYAYWGEYPLSFAACLGLSDCYKLLLAKGANPNRQDSNGNATLHMIVIANKIDMFDLCYSTGANLSTVNKQNLTPLTLAAKLRRTKMFFHILTIMRQVDWIFCNVGFVKFPLDGVDSVNTSTGQSDENSALSIVVFGGSNEHLEMLDGLLSQLLAVKWDTFIKENFYSWLQWFFAIMLVSMVAYITRFETQAKHNDQQSAYMKPKLEHILNLNSMSELFLVASAIHYLTKTTYRLAPSFSFKSIIKSFAQAPELLMFSFTCLLILVCIPLRLLQWKSAEDLLASVVMFSLPLKLLFFCRASKSVGSFIVMIYKILVNDVLCFVVFLIIFVAGFSQSFLIIFQTHKQANSAQPPPPTTMAAIANASRAETLAPVDKNYFVNLFDAVISMHMMALNEFTTVFDEFDSTEYPRLSRCLFCIYMVLVSILLINMLIAMLGKTYQDIASQPNESLRQWARALLIVERLLSSGQRLQMLDRYTQLEARGYGPADAKRAASGDQHKQRYYNSTWALAARDLEEIAALQRLKDDNKTKAKRLATRPA